MEARPSQSLSLHAALESASWAKILPFLIEYAERRLRRLGWAEGHDYRPGALEVDELVNEAIMRCYSGVRDWDEQNPPDLVAFLCWVMKSISSATRKHRQRVDHRDDMTEQAAEVATAEEAFTTNEITHPRLRGIEEAIRDDPDLESLYLAILDDNTKREQIAEALGWSPVKVSVVRKKLNRRLAKADPPKEGDA